MPVLCKLRPDANRRHVLGRQLEPAVLRKHHRPRLFPTLGVGQKLRHRARLDDVAIGVDVLEDSAVACKRHRFGAGKLQFRQSAVKSVHIISQKVLALTMIIAGRVVVGLGRGVRAGHVSRQARRQRERAR